MVGWLVSGELEERGVLGDQRLSLDIAGRKTNDRNAMMVGVPDDSAVHRGNRFLIVDVERNGGRRQGKLAEVDILEDIEHGELFRQILGGLPRLLGHRVVLRRGVDAGDTGGVVTVMVPGVLCRLQKRPHHLRGEAGLERENVDPFGGSPTGDDKQPGPSGNNAEQDQARSPGPP